MNGSLKELIIKATRKMMRSFEYEQEFDTLFYFLNNFFDIREAKPAIGPLRDLQRCDVLLLAIFHEVCKKNQLNYWVDSGTLLGLYRHGGFVPWDDDLDVCMLRPEYEKALQIFPKVLGEYGFEVNEFSDYPMSSFGIGYKHKKSGIWLDVYPVDSVTNVDTEKAVDTLEKNLWRYKKFYLKNKKRKPVSKIIEKKEKIVNNGLAVGRDELLYLAVEYDYNKLIINRKSNIFPLDSAKFEGYKVNVPHKIPEYLSSIYGESYMEFPRSGVAHHGGENGKLYEWAINSSTNMEDIFCELKEIYTLISEN